VAAAVKARPPQVTDGSCYRLYNYDTEQKTTERTKFVSSAATSFVISPIFC